MNRGMATNSGTSGVFNFVNTFNNNVNLNTSDELSQAPNQQDADSVEPHSAYAQKREMQKAY